MSQSDQANEEYAKANNLPTEKEWEAANKEQAWSNKYEPKQFGMSHPSNDRQNMQNSQDDKADLAEYCNDKK